MAQRNKKVSWVEISEALSEQKDLIENEVNSLFPEIKLYLDKDEIFDFGRFCQKVNKLFDVKRASG